MNAATDIVDLFVIGGGINGAGIARDAAGRGLSVILCEKDDLAQGTWSRSGKLVHGGLRYLEYYEFRLVREALIEREVLLNVAPAHHLADALRAAAQPGGPAGLARPPRPVPLRPSRRPQEAAGHAHARPAPAIRKARRSSINSRGASNIPTAGSTTPGSCAQRARRAGAGRRGADPHGLHLALGARTAPGPIEIARQPHGRA